MKAAQRKQPPPVNHVRQWIFGISATLLATAVIQMVRMWVAADAYDAEVSAIVAPLERKADEATIGVERIANELKVSRLQVQRNQVEQDIYKLESEKFKDPKAWNARDDQRLNELREKEQKLESALTGEVAK